MHTLSQLKSGDLIGTQRLSLSENLTSFPLEILTLADSLEILDLSNNQLTSLPKELAKLTKLKILFASNNHFHLLVPTNEQDFYDYPFLNKLVVHLQDNRHWSRHL